jgi:phage tail-like protein
MNLVSSNQCFQFSLTPLQLSDRVQDGLIVYPGEPSEIVVQVKNLLKQESLNLNLTVEGNFPSHWCQIGTEGNALPPESQLEAVLYFQVPDPFFEDPQALQFPHQQRLQLQYDVRVTIHASDKTHTAIEQSEFHLYVRPRSLYLDFLPDLYRETSHNETAAHYAQEVDFIGRFLKIFEQTFEPAVHSFDALWAYLDPLTAPQAMLPFLAHWVGWNPEPDWELANQRRLIRQAIDLYRWRGTRKGLRQYLHWYTGLPLDDSITDESKKHISITEPFGTGFTLGDAILGESTRLGGGRPFHFSIDLRASLNHPSDRLNEAILHRLIEQEKPVFCTYDLTIIVLDREL